MTTQTQPALLARTCTAATQPPDPERAEGTKNCFADLSTNVTIWPSR